MKEVKSYMRKNVGPTHGRSLAEGCPQPDNMSLPGRGEGTTFQHLHTVAIVIGQVTAIFKGCIDLFVLPLPPRQPGSWTIVVLALDSSMLLLHKYCTLPCLSLFSVHCGPVHRSTLNPFLIPLLVSSWLFKFQV